MKTTTKFCSAEREMRVASSRSVCLAPWALPSFLSLPSGSRGGALLLVNLVNDTRSERGTRLPRLNWELGNSVHRGARPACPFDPPALPIFVKGNLWRREACPSCRVVIVRDSRAHIRYACKMYTKILNAGHGKKGSIDGVGGRYRISFMGRSSCSWWSAGPLVRRSVCCGRIPFPLKGQLRKRGKNGQIVLPMHFRPQELRGALHLFGWIRGRLTRVDRQTDSY